MSQWSEDYLLEKIITYSWHSYILQAEITSLDYRYVYAHCRRGLSTFAAFCLSKDVLTQNKAISCVGCRSPPANLDFQKNSDWRKQYGIQQSQRRKEMAALERSRGKTVTELVGVNEDDIEKLRVHDWTIFNSDRRYYQRVQETGTYLDELVEDTTQPEVKTVEDFLDSIENQHLYQVLIKVDRLTLQIALMKIQGYSTREIAVYLDITEKAVYRRMDRLKEKLKKLFE